MDTWRAISTVRAVRAFRPDPLAPTVIERILDAARHTGSSKNLQRWDFIVVTDRDRLARLAQVGRHAGHLGGAAAAVAIVTPDPFAKPSRLSVVWDAGRAAQNMVVAAWAEGIGSVPATVYEQDLAREILGYPEDRHCGHILSFGYPADPADLIRPPSAGGRKSLKEIVHRERW